MRKFKIKNRQKRKYTRRKGMYTYVYLSKLSAVVLIPPFIIIAVFSIFVFSFNFSIPSILSVPPISLKHFYQSISKINLPNISIQLKLPEVDLAQVIEQTTYRFNILADTVTAVIRQLVGIILNLSQLLDPRPSITIMLNTVAAALVQFDKIIITLLSTTGNLIVFIAKKLVLNVQNGVIYIINILSALIFVIIDILLMVVAVINKTNEFLIQSLTIIESPFIRLYKDLLVFAPFITKVTKILTDSGRELLTNMGTIVKFFLQPSKNI